MRGRRNVLLALAAAALISAASFSSWGIALDRLSIDLLHLIHFRVFGPPPVSDEIAILAIDEATYQDKESSIAFLPQALWTPQFATVLNAVIDAQPKVVGVDMILATSAEGAIPGYDRPWRLALDRASKQNKIVLTYAQHQSEPVEPVWHQFLAVHADRNPRNISPANVQTDDDGVVRRVPLLFFDKKGDAEVPGFATELYLRAQGQGTDTLSKTDDILLNFAAANRPPLYSFGDILACAEQGNSAFFRDHFANRIVLLGGVLDIEDRRLTSGRFATLPEGANAAPSCVDRTKSTRSGQRRDLMPGVLIHAAAIDNLTHGSALRELTHAQKLIALLALTFLSAIAFVALKPQKALIIWILLGLALATSSVVAFTQFLAIPIITGLIAMALAAPTGIAIRMGSMDRARRQLRNAFSLYLPRSEVDRLVREEKLPSLGGELRDVTILFSDIASYSTLSERVEPGPLVDELNRYFGRMTDIVQAHGGFVDKYIGDGVLAIFGAPLLRENSSADAVRASLAMIRSLQEEPLFIGGDGRIAIRVGLHRGEAIVGNIGSSRRFNYTVMGDAVNVASRLEGVGKHYGIPIVVSEQVEDAAAADFAFRELDFIRVVGRDQPVRLYQPLEPEAAQGLDLEGFAAALGLWRKGSFTEAASAFSALAANGDTLAARYVSWAESYAKTPMSDWEGVIQQGSK